MKLITVIIKPFKLEEVRASLEMLGVTGMYRGAEYVIDFLPKIKVEIAVSVDQVDDAIDAITKSANTGKIGDGKIFVSSLDKVIRIRTGETDQDAI